MITDAVVTIYNRVRGNKSTLDTWHRTVLDPAHVYIDTKVSVGDDGLNTADDYKIRIPGEIACADKYLAPDEYQKSEESANHWTIQNDDYVVIGDSSVEIEKPADLKKLNLKCCRVVSWSDNRRGATPHWRIGGV